MKSVSTHEFKEPVVIGKTIGSSPKDIKADLPDGTWGVSPSNCCIAGTGNNKVSQSFYSIVIGKCMAYCDTYQAPNQRPWDPEITAIVTLHIVLENGFGYTDTRIVQHNATENQTLSTVAQTIYEGWEEKHQGDAPNQKPKNPFQAFYDLMRVEAPDVF
ncbi:MAG: hypothetical protein LBG43_04080 [Treponema sp.]|nr:hypothetical protein [Treponema sp.]